MTDLSYHPQRVETAGACASCRKDVNAAVFRTSARLMHLIFPSNLTRITQRVQPVGPQVSRKPFLRPAIPDANADTSTEDLDIHAIEQ